MVGQGMMQNRNESELCDLHKANYFRKNGLFTIHESKGKSEEWRVFGLCLRRNRKKIITKVFSFPTKNPIDNLSFAYVSIPLTVNKA